MKAAVLHNFGETPKYEDFPDPTPGQDEVLIQVKAVALEIIDRMMVEGTHFASQQFLSTLPAIIGFDGIGTLEDGSLIGFGGTRPPYGAMAEKTVVPKTNVVPIPEGIDPVAATAIPTALTALPLKFAGKFQPGETVFINGATGAAGKAAIQVAKLLGAGRVVGTGRNEASMKRSIELGADTMIDLKQSDERLIAAFKKEIGHGCDIILDFLWGHPTELLIKALVPEELTFGKRVRLIQIGETAGSSISLPADALRTTGLEIYGATAGLSPEVMSEGSNQAIEWIKTGKLQIDIEQVPLKDIERLWKRTDFQGKRIVVVP
jgi:NADPH:quinone reductase-like Zn-dependent oxidoreductase